MRANPTKKRKTETKDKKVINKKPRFSYPKSIAAPSSKGPEWKQFDVTSGAIALSSGVGGWSTPVLVNGIAAGTGVTQRLGRKLLMRKMVLRLGDQWLNSNMVISGFSPLRTVIIYDREPTGALPAVLDIFDTSSILSNMNLSNSDRFMVLVDTLETDWANFSGINPAQTSQLSIISPVIVRKFPEGLESQYKDVATGGIGDFTKGACYILTAQDVTAVYSGAGATRTLDYVIRWRFTDN